MRLGTFEDGFEGAQIVRCHAQSEEEMSGAGRLFHAAV